MKRLAQPIEQVADRAREREVWWAEATGRGDELYLVRSANGVIADGLTQKQAMMLASEYNQARTDAEKLAKHCLKGQVEKSV